MNIAVGPFTALSAEGGIRPGVYAGFVGAVLFITGQPRLRGSCWRGGTWDAAARAGSP